MLWLDVYIFTSYRKSIEGNKIKQTELAEDMGKLGAGSQREGVFKCKRSRRNQIFLTTWKFKIGVERREEWIGGVQRIFRAVEPLCMILYWWLNVTHLSKPAEYTPLKVNPKENYGLWMIKIGQYRFINFNKGTTLMWKVDYVEGQYRCGVREYLGNLFTFYSILL